MKKIDFDVTIIGGGVIGLSICYYLSKLNTNLKILLVEKENKVSLINSSRNTEVIHAGIYYKKNSLKAKFCILGKNKIYNFCKKYKIKYKKIGKLFIDNSKNSYENLNIIFNNGLKNNVSDLEIIEKKDLNKLEPNLNSKIALFSPSSGIFDTYEFSQKLEAINLQNEVTIAMNTSFYNAENFSNFWKVYFNNNIEEFITSKFLINSSGLNSLEISQKIFNLNINLKKNFTKGCYLRYSGKSPFNKIIYPSLTPGILNSRVDATPDINGGLRFGPSSEDPNDKIDFNTNVNLINIFFDKIKDYFPNIEKNKLSFDTVGIRPKILEKKSKDPLDFKITYGNNFVDLVNIESPGLTSCLSIGENVAEYFIKKY